MSEFKVTVKVRVEEVGVVIKVINSPKGKTSHLNNRKSSLRTRPKAPSACKYAFIERED